MDNQRFILNNGIGIPAVGLGTGTARGMIKHPKATIKRFFHETYRNIINPDFKRNNKYPFFKDLKKDMTLKKIAITAYQSGYRLFDTARAYAYSEEYIGESLFAKGKVKREDVFLISKITNTSQRNHTVLEDFEISLKNLRTDYLDLLLMHWPQPEEYLNTWKVMEQLYKDGKVRAIGVCNCHIHHLEELKNIAEIPVMANEIECHFSLQQWEDRKYCKENNIQLIAYSPTGKMNSDVINDSNLLKILRKHNLKSVSQIIMRWHYQLGDVSIPNTTSIEHLKENIDIFHFELDDEDMEQIRRLDKGIKIWPDSDSCDYYKL